MEKYISKKVVHAEPMTSDEWQFARSGFDNYSDATLDTGLDGYHVVYGLGSDSEYHSWSPKEQFELGNLKTGQCEYGINHDDGVIDIIFGDGMTGVQPLAYDEQEDGKYGMAGIVICRDGKHTKPFGENADGDIILSKQDRVFVRADNVRSLQVIINKLEEAKLYLLS